MEEELSWRFSNRTFMGPTLIPSSSKRDRRKNRWWGVSANFADLTLCEVKFRAPNEKAAARVLVVDEDVDGRSGKVGEGGIVAALVLWDDRCRISRRWNCKALARAFSWLRTKAASC